MDFTVFEPVRMRDIGSLAGRLTDKRWRDPGIEVRKMRMGVFGNSWTAVLGCQDCDLSAVAFRP